MRFPSFLLILPIALCTFHGALAQTQGYVEAYASINCTDITFSSLVFEGPALNNCEFSACTTFSGAGISRIVTFQQPRMYIGSHDVLYGNYTVLMYTTTGCTGTSQLLTIARKSILPTQFYLHLFALEIPLCLCLSLKYCHITVLTK